MQLTVVKHLWKQLPQATDLHDILQIESTASKYRKLLPICEIGTTVGGNDVFSGNVAGALSWIVTGTYGKRYYCRVRARDLAGYLSAWSANSDGITVVKHSGVTITDAKAYVNAESVGLSSKAVTAIFGDHFYIEETDRFAGIMVKPVDGIPAGLAVGNLVDIGGVLDATNQERWLASTVSLTGGTAAILPLGMNNKYIGGGDWQYVASPLSGQKGIVGSTGLNNIGLLVKTHGIVTPIDSSSFWISDGSGVNIKVITPAAV